MLNAMEGSRSLPPKSPNNVNNVNRDIVEGNVVQIELF